MKGICILLSGPDYEELEIVKSSLKLIFLVSKNLLLEKDILFLDKVLYKDVLQCQVQTCESESFMMKTYQEKEEAKEDDDFTFQKKDQIHSIE